MTRETYRLKLPLWVVAVQGDDIGSLEQLPTGAVVMVVGDSSIDGVAEILHQGFRYAVNTDDLLYRADVVAATAR